MKYPKNSYNLLTYIFISSSVTYMRAFKFMDYNQVYRKWHNLVQIKLKERNYQQNKAKKYIGKRTKGRKAFN